MQSIKFSVETVAVFFTLLSVILTVMKSKFCWPVGIVGILIYAYIFLKSHLYGDFGLQGVFFIQSFYGWFAWEKRPVFVNKEDEEVAFLMMFFFLAGFLMITDDPYPFWDAFITVGSIAATHLLAEKDRKSWLVWLAVDIVSVFIYYKRGLEQTSYLYILFTIIAIFGYLRWRRQDTSATA